MSQHANLVDTSSLNYLIQMDLQTLQKNVTAIQDLSDIASFKRCVQDCYTWLNDSFSSTQVDDLVTGRADFVDTLLTHAWTLSGLKDVPDLSLVAVGGYGRGQLQPYSDIDLLILSKKTLKPAVGDKVSAFITLLWDCRLDVGQAVRTIKDCVEQAKLDITVATNIVESRCLIGSETLFAAMLEKVNHKRVWSSKDFFSAKYEEQKQRHSKFNDTSYNLEPNVKENPGCLRDIQSIGWVAKKHFKEYDGYELVGHGYFTEQEHQELINCRSQLWRIRFALHLVAGRSENRLLFDYQADVAHKLGFNDSDKKSVENMMKGFFRIVRRVTELNTMLLQRFKVDILNTSVSSGRTLNDDFVLCEDKISPRHQHVFKQPEDVFTFLELVANTPDSKGLDFECIRLLRNARREFSSAYWVEYPSCREAFMRLMKNPAFFNLGWDIMHLHGILQAYLPQWDNVVGMMQFDLFHAYTVDEHTYRLVKFIAHYFSPLNRAFPRCGNIVKNLDKPELLFIAGIFHDIGKGRGGDHSKLGAADVIEFGEKHGLSSDDTAMISWLVESHLLMSVVAQRRDIYDPEVINDFASTVKSTNHLNLLYALTLADIRATNDNLWNDWKSSLLKELYVLTTNALENGLQCQVTLFERAEQNKTDARELLVEKHSAEAISELWQRLDNSYFTRFKPVQIAWHTSVILQHTAQNADSWLIKMSNDTTKAGSELLIYGKDRPAMFAQIASVLDSSNLSILDAHIAITPDKYVFDSIIVTDGQNEKIANDKRLKRIEDAIQTQLEKPTVKHDNNRKLSRRLKQLNVPTKVRFFSASDDATLIELEALDAPGLLAEIGHIFVDFNLTLRLAKISTIGERAEDIFIVSDEFDQALNTELQLALKKQIILQLDQSENHS